MSEAVVEPEVEPKAEAEASTNSVSNSIQQWSKSQLNAVYIATSNLPWSTLVTSNFSILLYDFIFNLFILAMYASYNDNKNVRKNPYALGSIIMHPFILVTFLTERVNLHEIKIFQVKKWNYFVFLIKYLKYFAWFFFFLLTLLKVNSLSTGSFENPFDLPPASSHTNFSATVAYIIIYVVTVIVDSALLSIWWEQDLKSVFVLFRGTQVIQILFSIAMVQTNVNLINMHNMILMKRIHNLYILTSTFLITQSGYGLSLSFILNERNRLTELAGQFLAFFISFAICLFLLIIACFILSIYYFTNGNDNIYGDIPVCIPIIFGCIIIFELISFFCARYFRNSKPRTKLLVEEYNLSELTEQQKLGWSKLINLNSRYNGGISGDRVLSLMENYSTNHTLSGVKFKVLRVYKNPSEDVNKKSKKKNLKNDDLENNVKKESKKFNDDSTMVESRNSIEKSNAWDSFDKESLVFSTTNVEDSLSSGTSLDEFKPLSKNQLKRLAKKKSKMQKMEDLELIQKNSEKFYNDLKCTEALVLLTILDSFDLTERIPGKFGEVLSKWFGKDSKFPLLCIKFGLVGFHWPFKRSTVYCSSTKKPVARSAAIMYSIAKWNKAHEKCTVLLDPTYKDDVAEPGIRLGGWVKVILPNSHVIDLRPYMNKTIDQYYKGVKYRNHDNVFVQDHGEVIETFDFNEENCSDIIKLTELISDSRQNSGQSETLLKPTSEFISHFGNTGNENHYRSLLFLKVEGKLIASCVIFRLGDTITSDIQGLDHEISKKYKAYFVMMQEVIKIALREKISFVDFGPTTEHAKVDIGCKVVPLVGSLSARNPVLSPILKLAASKVNV